MRNMTLLNNCSYSMLYIIVFLYGSVRETNTMYDIGDGNMYTQTSLLFIKTRKSVNCLITNITVQENTIKIYIATSLVRRRKFRDVLLKVFVRIYRQSVRCCSGAVLAFSAAISASRTTALISFEETSRYWSF